MADDDLDALLDELDDLGTSPRAKPHPPAAAAPKGQSPAEAHRRTVQREPAPSVNDSLDDLLGELNDGDPSPVLPRASAASAVDAAPASSPSSSATAVAAVQPGERFK